MRRSLHIFWVNPFNQRTYRVIIQRDIFGNLVLLTMNGSLINQHGGMRAKVCEKLSDAFATLREIIEKREERGYKQIKPKPKPRRICA